MRGLIVGRFQPFHNGHLMLIKHVLDECNEIIIAIASAQFNYLLKDPFTAGERVEMIHNALKDADIDLARCYIIPIINDENNARWFLHLRSYLPKFDIVYSGNEYVRMLLADYVKVSDVRFYDREKYNASRIRELMINDGEWRALVPRSVYEFINRIDGVKRLKIIANAESKPQEW
ncbi:MAG: nicotinamide-nucleotide adenylyltransferase [Candidatus Nitrosothermus koennekii]|nr:MAG: nicotinamide-nucleotide adenylyltransferase [Candidatus Nitrosothermus koennekii]